MGMDFVNCLIPTNPIVGAVGEIFRYLQFVWPVIAIGLFATWFFLKRKNQNNISSAAFIVRGLVYYVIAVVAIVVPISLPFPFVFLLIPILIVSALAFGSIPLSILLWRMSRTRYKGVIQTPSAQLMSRMMLVAILGIGLLSTLLGLILITPKDANYSEIRMYRTGAECFEHGGTKYETVEGDMGIVHYPDGRTEEYPRW